MKLNSNRMMCICILIYIISISICVILLSIHIIKLEKYVDDTKGYILDELLVMDAKIEESAKCPYESAIDNIIKGLLNLETKMKDLSEPEKVDLTDIEKELDKLEERVTDLENGE